MSTCGYLTQSGPWIPCLKEGEKTYTFTPEELSELLRKAYAEGYQRAKDIYYVPEVTVSSSVSWDVVEETAHGTH